MVEKRYLTVLLVAGAMPAAAAEPTPAAHGDGFLTVDAIGGANTKIDYIIVTPSNPDQPPAVPKALTATAGDATVNLDWTDKTDSDLKGYNVFRGTADAVATTGTPLNGTTVLTASTVTDTTAANDTTYRYVVVAVDNADQSSAAPPAPPQPRPLPTRSSRRCR